MGSMGDELKKRSIYDLYDLPNIATALGADELAQLGEMVVTGYEIDLQSRHKWEGNMKEALDLAMQVWEEKNFPFEKSANVKYPLLSTAAIQFSSRAYPNIIRGKQVVKAKVIGNDPNGEKAQVAQRISDHMSWQCTDEMEEWEPDTDRGLTVLPILGCFFKKSYFSPDLGRNVSEYKSPLDVVIHYFAKSMKSAPRITDKLELYPNEIEERKRSDVYLDEDFGMAITTKNEDAEVSSMDEDRAHVFLEQHRFLDLDGDGYQEPYIVTVHLDSRKVARIVPRFDIDDIAFRADNSIRRIEPLQYFTKYTFMPSADGSIYDFGFGSLLGPINQTINTTTNQLIDSGTIANSQTGFLGKGINLGRGRSGGPIRLKMNEWTPVPFSGDDLRKNILPLPTKEPSTVLFSLLGFMVGAGEKMSVSELLTGEQTVHNEPAATSLMRVEQGLKVFSSIHKRIHRALKEEFKKLKRLNKVYLDEEIYYTAVDSPNAAFRGDYDDNLIDIEPVSNVGELTDEQRLGKAQVLMGMMGQGLDDNEIRRRFLEAANISDIDSLFPQTPPQPDPKLVLESEKLDIERAKLEFDMMKFGYEMVKLQTEAMLNIAKAESLEEGTQLDQYKAEVQSLMTMMQGFQRGTNGNNRGRVQGMASRPGNEGSV